MEEKPKISLPELIFMLLVAGVFDILDFLIGLISLGFMVTIPGYILFWIWFTVKGIKNRGQRILIAGLSDIMTSLTEILSFLPFFTGLVIFTYIKIKIEEKIPAASEIGKIV